jgi:hypothetical protein
MKVVSFDVGIKNLAYSILSYDEDKIEVSPSSDKKQTVLSKTTIQEWHKIDLESSKYDLERITKNLLEVLDNIAYHEIEDIHHDKVHVVIENQPALKSPTMKSIQIVIYSYFNTIAKYNSLDMKIRLISAKSKLKYIDSFKEFADYMNKKAEEFDITSSKKRIPKEKQGYAKNKDDSVQFSKWLLENVMKDTYHLNELENLKKKDDVCDSLLQGLYYLTSL